jgi:hypothetical protein
MDNMTLENFTLTSEGIHEIYSVSYSIPESRGKKRQEKINEIIIKALKLLGKYDECNFSTEVRIKDKINWGKFFTVDVEVFKSGKLIEIFLIKAPASNIAQNRVNMLNSRGGEVIRIAPLIKSGVKLTFITLQPNKSPFFTTNGDIKSFEDNEVKTISCAKEYLTVDFSEVTITFDIEGIENCINKKEVKDMFSNKEIITNIQVHI